MSDRLEEIQCKMVIPESDIQWLISRVEELEKELRTYKSAYKAEAHWRADETRHKEKAQAENERLRDTLGQVQADTQYIWWE